MKSGRGKASVPADGSELCPTPNTDRRASIVRSQSTTTPERMCVEYTWQTGLLLPMSPRDSGRTLAVRESMCSSATQERKLRFHHHHLLDP